MSIGVGMCTTSDRMAYFDQSATALRVNLEPIVDHWSLARDVAPVAAAKNMLFEALLDRGCDWIFICEDDIVVQSPEAITGYLEACKSSGWEHLNFAHHGPANLNGPLAVDGLVAYYPNFVGAWSVYSRRSLEQGGLMDETFYNAFEHVEHTMRLAELGFTAKWPRVADARDSSQWLMEIPGSIEHSSIRQDEQWTANFDGAKAYWRATKPQTYHQIWP